jgi:hypothetical protein
MKKNYIVAISILIGLWVAFMAYRHVTRKQETEQYEAKEYSRVTVIARQSPRAGLGQMARALQKYYEKKQAYPSRLIELYPEYLGNKSFIEEIDWYYEPRGNNFYLSKTVIRDNRRMVASIDRGLMPRVETGVMVAAPTPTPKPAQAERREGLFAERPEISITSREEFWEMLRLREKGITPASWAKRDKRRIIASIRPEILSVVELDATSTLEDQLSQRYLVWKDRNGILGIGNVQYPATQRQTVYAMGSWYDIKVPFPTEEGPITPDAKTAKKTGGPEVIASSLSQRHLVWRSRHGILGFGNVGYPQRDRVSVFQDDGWVNVERPVAPAETSNEEAYEPEQGKPVETIASELSTRYLVWKDEKTLGFGNVGYPQRDRVSVFQDDGWVNVERPPPLPADIRAEGDYGSQKAKPPEKITSELSNRYLVWKDQHGTLGFGNVEYPETDNISHVHVNGSWEKVIN